MAGNTMVRVEPGKSTYLPNGTRLTVVKGVTLGPRHPDMVQVRDDEGMPIFGLSAPALLESATPPGESTEGLVKIISVELAAGDRGAGKATAVLVMNNGYTSVRVPFDYTTGVIG